MLVLTRAVENQAAADTGGSPLAIWSETGALCIVAREGQVEIELGEKICGGPVEGSVVD